MRWWRRKATAFERGAWVVGGEAGMEASGQAGEACRWRASSWERAGLEMRTQGCCSLGLIGGARLHAGSRDSWGPQKSQKSPISSAP